MGVPKFHVPDFDGSSDPLQWLHHCNQCFDAWKTTEEDKMWFATLRLTGVAYQWYCKIERNRGMPTWEQFAGKISRRFAQVPAPVKPDAPSGTVAPEATAATPVAPRAPLPAASPGIDVLLASASRQPASASTPATPICSQWQTPTQLLLELPPSPPASSLLVPSPAKPAAPSLPPTTPVAPPAIHPFAASGDFQKLLFSDSTTMAGCRINSPSSGGEERTLFLMPRGNPMPEPICILGTIFDSGGIHPHHDSGRSIDRGASAWRGTRGTTGRTALALAPALHARAPAPASVTLPRAPCRWRTLQSCRRPPRRPWDTGSLGPLSARRHEVQGRRAPMRRLRQRVRHHHHRRRRGHSVPLPRHRRQSCFPLRAAHHPHQARETAWFCSSAATTAMATTPSPSARTPLGNCSLLFSRLLLPLLLNFNIAWQPPWAASMAISI